MPETSSTELSPGMGFPQWQHSAPGREPVTKKEEQIATTIGSAGCVAPSTSGLSYVPADATLQLGTSYTFYPTGLAGSTPFTYLWQINIATQPDTTPAFTHTLVDADIVDKDGSGLGTTLVFAVITNACGSVTATTTPHPLPAQGTP